MMASVTFTPPKRWEDWCDWALGIWLLLSPWILLFEKDAVATRNAVIIGLLIVLTEAVTLSIFRVWEEWINVALGAWLVISPWVLPVTDSLARTDFVIVGLLVAGLALFEVWEVSRLPTP
jgi:SPW repeat